MKFTVLDVTSSQESESDYETAVELSHSSIAETTLRLQTEAGLVLRLNDCQIHTTYSYLNTEPEFEEDEEEVAPEYAIPSGNRQAKDSRYLSGTAISEPELPALSAEDWKFHEDMEDSGGWHDDRNEMPDSVRRNLLTLDNYHALVNEGTHGKKLVPEFVQRLVDALPTDLVAGQVVEVSLAPAEEADLNRFAAMSRAQSEANQRVGVENQITRNVAHAKADIAEAVEAARHRFKPR